MNRRFAATLCVMALAATAAIGTEPATDGAIPVEQLSVADLEQAFWECDYFATTRGIASTPASKCAVVTATLKKVKFKGDYEALLAWWRDNKVTEHARLRRQFDS